MEISSKTFFADDNVLRSATASNSEHPFSSTEQAGEKIFR
jgi:hypothetical protein